MTNNKQQTAVDFFYNKLIENTSFSINGIYDLYKQAKEMEEIQIIKARSDGNSSTKCDCVLNSFRGGRLYMTKSNQTYYNETYKEDKQ